MECVKWTPFQKQVFVLLGVSINLAQTSLTVGYAAVLLPQLEQPDSLIPIDDYSGSWIASIVGITLIVGNVVAATIMGKYGRRVAGIISASIAVFGWIWIPLATSITSILIARSIQGIHTGMAIVISPIVTGECGSPTNRAAFTSLSVLMVSLAMLCIHSVGAYLSWQTTGLIAATISFVDLLILIYSPESPSWLADQGRYEECKKNFRWLRGDNEEEELMKIIEACKLTREVKCSRVPQKFFRDIAANLRKYTKLLMRREFYIPCHIVLHLYITCSWNGLIPLAVYIKDYYRHVVGPDVDFGMQITLLGISRIIANVFGIYITKVVRRRVLLGTAVGINIVILFLTAIYAYIKLHKILPVDYPFIGILLSHIHIISIVIGSLTLPVAIAAELFPLEFRSFAGACVTCIYSIAYFISLKCVPFIINSCGFHGLFLIYGIVMSYCLIAALLFLPETKDRTLQDIENELRGKYKGCREEAQSEPLNILDSNK